MEDSSAKAPQAPINSERQNLLQASDENAVEALRHFTRLTPGGVVEEDDELVLAASSHPYVGPMHNAAFRIDPRADPHRVVTRAQHFFWSLGRGFVLWVSGHADSDLAEAARDSGLRPRGPGQGAAGMVVDVPFDEWELPPQTQLVRVTDVSHAKAFGTIVADAFADRPTPQPREATLAMFANPEVLLHHQVISYIAQIDDIPVACAMAFISAATGGIYWVSTVQQARNRGLGNLLTRVLTNLSFASGTDAVVLQSSSMGESLYRRMGFRELTRYQRYICHSRVPDSLH
jgi:ribosomal protein S18 acetylase RimI-like enzyme